MDPRQNLPLIDSLPGDWKWRALFELPEPLQLTWRAWLADAQRAEEQSVLRYWAQRSTGEQDRAA